jgi:hypothetical protein
MGTPMKPVDMKLADALREAGDRVAAMTPVQRALMAARQAVSYVEGGLGVALPDDHEAKITVRALALLDRAGDAAADALTKREAAVVPVEATDEMHSAGVGHMGYYHHMDPDNWVYGDQSQVWSAMLAAGRLDKENDDA